MFHADQNFTLRACQLLSIGFIDDHEDLIRLIPRQSESVWCFYLFKIIRICLGIRSKQECHQEQVSLQPGAFHISQRLAINPPRLGEVFSRPGMSVLQHWIYIPPDSHCPFLSVSGTFRLIILRRVSAVRPRLNRALQAGRT